MPGVAGLAAIVPSVAAARTYGFSWTAKEKIARDFSNRFCRASEGGSALSRTVAPMEAIICAPALIDNRYAEQEYLVDRRRLGAVEVLERYPQRGTLAPHS
jgi:hypothetical protein